jgi:hypothetical protein
MNTSKFPKPSDFVCTACATGKLIVRPSYLKIKVEPLTFLEHIQGDVCGPIHPLTEPFRYFRILIDASMRWSHVCLLSTRNQAFARFISQITKLRAHYLDNPIKSIDYCMALGINMEHHVPYVHTQNGLAESLIKRVKLIARPLL